MATPVDAKLLRQTKFPPEFSRKVDMTKVNIEVMKKWIAGKISEILGNEDDVVIELCFNLLEGTRYPNIKELQIQLTGFLDKDTSSFCKELWSLCLSGQENPQGVPKELLEAKKLELIQEKLEAERAAESTRRQREQDLARERDLEDLRKREREDRGRARRGPGRGGRDFDRRRSRSPRNRSRDRYREPPSRREFDSYVPSSSHRGRRPTRSPSRTRPSSRSTSRSPRRHHHDRRDRSSDRRRRTYSRSTSPKPRDRRERRRNSDHGDRYRSNTRSDSSRSRTPRRDQRRRRSVSRSVTPPSRHRHHSKYSDSKHRDRSRSHSYDRGAKSHRADIHDHGHNKSEGYERYRSRSRSYTRHRGRHERHQSRSPAREHDGRRSPGKHSPIAPRKRVSSPSARDEKRRRLTDHPSEDAYRSPMAADGLLSEPRDPEDTDEVGR